MRVFVSQKICIACRRCYVYYPEVFKRDQKGIARPQTFQPIKAEYEDMAIDAIETCPVGAIFFK